MNDVQDRGTSMYGGPYMTYTWVMCSSATSACVATYMTYTCPTSYCWLRTCHVHESIHAGMCAKVMYGRTSFMCCLG